MNKDISAKPGLMSYWTLTDEPSSFDRSNKRLSVHECVCGHNDITTVVNARHLCSFIGGLSLSDPWY